MLAGLQDRMSNAAGQAAANEATKYAGEQVTLRWEQCKYMSTIRTVVGIIFVFFVWSTAFGLNGAGIYCIFLGPIVTLLEFSFLLNKLTCCPPAGWFCTGWHFFLKLDSWRRGIFYVVVCIPLFIPVFSISIWGYLAGIAGITSAVLYIAKHWQYVHGAPEYNQYGNAPGGTGGGAIQDPSQFNSIPP